MRNSSQVILALDFNDMASTVEMINLTKQHIAIYKLGLEFYLAHGKAASTKFKVDLAVSKYFLI